MYTPMHTYAQIHQGSQEQLPYEAPQITLTSSSSEILVILNYHSKAEIRNYPQNVDWSHCKQNSLLIQLILNF